MQLFYRQAVREKKIDITPEINYNIIYYTSNYSLNLHLFYHITVLSKYIIKFIIHSLHKGEVHGTDKLR